MLATLRQRPPLWLHKIRQAGESDPTALPNNPQGYPPIAATARQLRQMRNAQIATGRNLFAFARRIRTHAQALVDARDRFPFPSPVRVGGIRKVYVDHRHVVVARGRRIAEKQIGNDPVGN